MIGRNRGSAATGRLSFLLGCIALVSAPRAAWAEIRLTPFGSLNVLSDSNVFARSSDRPPFAETGNSDFADVVSRYTAGVATDFTWSRDRLGMAVEKSRVLYNRFSLLDHSEYRLDGHLEWQLGSVFDGTFSYLQADYMAPFADTLAAQLLVDSTKMGEGRIGILAGRRWRLDFAHKVRSTDMPLSRYPDFGLHESSDSLAANFLWTSTLKVGLRATYSYGAFHGIVDSTKYHQSTSELTSEYSATGRSSFNAQLGFTRRNSQSVSAPPASDVVGAIGTASAMTGAIGYRRQLTGKTAVTMRVSRQIDSYVGGANPVIGYGSDVEILWEPDVRISLSVRYHRTQDTIRGNLALEAIADRRDCRQSLSLEAKYQPRPWLAVRPYATKFERSSNLAIANYSANLVGVEVTMRLGEQESQ
jgi:hypothetical protein